ncbi:glycosyltransferase [Enterococcus cecorum]|uniref:Glycosyltransferase 2-like domain-containing protein n=1 Tax=Enterococcus cecorum TaxID=44008 RepID=A0A200HRS3_9ENTE|nr:glycosyltransferase [Enterococcus cecorum]OUZ14861.1 hypothetical protein A5869_001966 [Enterococcus cecorum]
MKSFAIVLVCYNRLPGVERLLKQLEAANYNGRKDITLIFSIDNSGTDIVEKFAEDYTWLHGNKIVRTFPERQGLKKHILQCGDYTDQFDIVTVFEDDIFVSDSFYNYAYQAAEYYWNDDNIAGISLYGFQKNWINWLYRFEPQRSVYDSYFLKIAQSWGQVWTKDKWSKFKAWYEKHTEFSHSDSLPQNLFTWPESSWLKYHDRYCMETNRYFVYPYVSLSTNYSDPGEHATYAITDHQVELQYGKTTFCFPKFDDKAVVYDEFMEREHLGRFVGIDDQDLCVSLWGTKQNCLYKKYILTSKVLPYRIVSEFSLSLRPIELSVIKSVEGKGIYLYDTTCKTNVRARDINDQLRIYSIRSHDVLQLFPFIARFWIKEVWKRIGIKIRKKIKRK